MEAVKYEAKQLPLVLVVDDEPSIRRTLEGVLRDEGFIPLFASDGASALSLLESCSPELILLDIWMPGLDGMETLERIRARYPKIPVIMMSGHATIPTALRATQLGARDFIEKPLDLNAVISVSRRALATREPVGDQFEDTTAAEALSFGSGTERAHIRPIVFSSQNLRGEPVVQKTLATSALLYGQGLHSGKKSGLIFEPLPAYSGIHFVGIAQGAPVPAHVDFVESTGFATTLRLGETQAGTIEHIMSALHAYGICNLLIKCNGEVPVMDGSAQDFCSLIEEIGLEEQEGEWFQIKVEKPIRIERGKEFISLEPADEFIIDYTLEYPEPVGRQRLVFTLGDVELYKKEIAKARTFGFVRDIGMLQKQGLALGGRFDNFVLIGDDGAINDTLRYPDEPVRHKILDAIGDLYLLGRPICGKVTAFMTGHSDNIELLKLLRKELEST